MGDISIQDQSRLYSQVGRIRVRASARHIISISILNPNEENGEFQQKEIHENFPLIDTVFNQLDAYFLKNLTVFNLPLDWESLTPFQQLVLRETAMIPFGTVRSYGGIAAAIGKPRAARAVGAALAKNPFVIVVPCHRVLAADMSLHGYSAYNGIQTKASLLALEGVPVVNSHVIGNHKKPL